MAAILIQIPEIYLFIKVVHIHIPHVNKNVKKAIIYILVFNTMLNVFVEINMEPMVKFLIVNVIRFVN